MFLEERNLSLFLVGLFKNLFLLKTFETQQKIATLPLDSTLELDRPKRKPKDRKRTQRKG